MNLKSINYWSYPGGLEGTLPVEEFLRLAKGHGYDAVEICIGEGGTWGLDVDEARCREILALADKIGIRIASCASGTYWSYSLGDATESNRRKAREALEKMLRITSWLGCRTLLTIPGAVDIFFDPNRPVQPYDEVLKFAREGLGAVIPTAEKLGVRMGIENVWNKFLLSPTEMAAFIDSFDSAAIGAYVDVANVLPFGYPEQWLRILGHRVAGIHFKDYRRAVGTAEGFVDLLEGDVDFPAVMKAIAEIGFDGPLVAELIPHYRHYPAVRCHITSIAMDAIMGRA